MRLKIQIILCATFTFWTICTFLSCQTNPPEGNNIHWNEGRKLRWNDFKDTNYSTDSEECASSYCEIYYHYNATGDSIVVIAIFKKDSSWVKKDSICMTMYVLSHEQGHFDLWEVWARKLRRAYATLNPRPTAKQIDSIFQAYSGMANKEQKRYDSITNHGTDSAQQRKWKGIIMKSLDSLKKYEDTNIVRRK